MRCLHDKFPKVGKFLKVVVYNDDSKRKHTAYLGTVVESNSKRIILGGLLEDTTPLRGCEKSGRFVPLNKDIISFPRPNVLPSLHFWKTERNTPTSVGQYLVYVNQQLLPLTIIKVQEFVPHLSTQTLICLIAGTHSFFAKDLKHLCYQLYVEGLFPFSEYSNSIYDDMLSLLRGTMQKKLLHELQQGLKHNPNQATELKLCV